MGGDREAADGTPPKEDGEAEVATTEEKPEPGGGGWPGKADELDGAAHDATAEKPEPEIIPVIAPGVVVKAKPVPPPVRKPRVLVIGDENLTFSALFQIRESGKDVTAATCLSRSKLEAASCDPCPKELENRVRHLVNPCRLGKHFHQYDFDELVCILPGLSFKVPEPLTPDSPLFAYRIHLFLFHLMRHAKLVCKSEGLLHVLWPADSGLAVSECGPAGIDLQRVARFCGLTEHEESAYTLDGLDVGFRPYILGELHEMLPDWCNDARFVTYTVTKAPINVPISVALTLHPDVGYVHALAPDGEDPGPPVGLGPRAAASLRTSLAREALRHKDKLRSIYEAKFSGAASMLFEDDMPGLIVQDSMSDGAVLEIPPEIFQLSFEMVSHVCDLLRFQICDDQPQVSVATIDLLDPRLPTRIARPPPMPKATAPMGGTSTAHVVLPPTLGGKKRVLPQHEEWGGMRFYCSLTKICTMTADKMRLHMEGDYYKKMAAITKDWDNCTDKKWLLEMLEESEALEAQMKKQKR